MSGDPSEDDPDSASSAADSVDEGLQHLETAMRELLQAGRAFLDALESAVGRPGALEEFLGDARRAGGASPETPPTRPPDAPPDDGFEDIAVE